MSTGNKFAPSYLVAERVYNNDRRISLQRGEPHRPWDELSLFERNQYVRIVDEMFDAMEEIGLDIPTEKMRRGQIERTRSNQSRLFRLQDRAKP